jgi:hypothetical protein
MYVELLNPLGAVLMGVSACNVDSKVPDRSRTLLAKRNLIVLPEQDIDDSDFVIFLKQFGPLLFTTGETPVDRFPGVTMASDVRRTGPPSKLVSHQNQLHEWTTRVHRSSSSRRAINEWRLVSRSDWPRYGRPLAIRCSETIRSQDEHFSSSQRQAAALPTAASQARRTQHHRISSPALARTRQPRATHLIAQRHRHVGQPLHRRRLSCLSLHSA